MRVAQRLERLEQLEAAQQTAGDGYAPESWGRLAPWAIAVHHAGGWQAAIALVKAGGMRSLPPPNPYGQASGGPDWDLTLFWQRGDTRRMPTHRQEQDALRLIVGGVAQLLEHGAPEAEIISWEMGRQAWQALMQALEGTADE